MHQEEPVAQASRRARGWLPIFGIVLALLVLPVFGFISLWYSEEKGSYKNGIEVVDLDGDGDLDVLISHTRWEDVGISWAGVGRWINHGNGKFELIQDKQMESFAGNAGAAGDIDQDGDMDVLVQDFGIQLLLYQGGQQGETPGAFKAATLVNPSSIPIHGHPDMGGKITMGDLNGDDKVDALATGCCYGAKQTLPSSDYEPSISWVWINDGRENEHPTGHIVTMDFLEGYPIRDVALGDIDGDGDLDAFAAVGIATLGVSKSMEDMILLNDGTGNMTVFEQSLGDTESTSVTLGDVNGDTCLDALVGTNTGAKLWINHCNSMKTGQPIFIPAEQSFATLNTFIERVSGWNLPVGSTRTSAVFLEDLDRDGDLDALIARVYEARLWWNDGLGNFQRSDVRLRYKEDTGIAVGDFNGDGASEIFTGNQNGDYRVWFNDGAGNFKPGR